MAAGPVNTRELWIWAPLIVNARPPTVTNPNTINLNHQRKETMPTTTRSKSQNSDIASSPFNMKHKIINYIRAGYPGLYLVSPEEQRVAMEMTQIAKELKYNLVFWSAVDGLVDTSKGSTTAANDPVEALIAIRDLKEKTLILLRDFHLFRFIREVYTWSGVGIGV
jgi:hypothetical protein